MKVGDSVRVKPGILDPDLSFDIGGWQGRVREVHGVKTVDIEWDSVTLRQMGLELIIKCENDNLDWRCMTLNQDEVEVVGSRDAQEDVAATVHELHDEMDGDPRLNEE